MGPVLITGASGFVGRHLVRWLTARGWRVRALARNPSALPAMPGLETAVLPDLAAPCNWRDALAGVTHVVHLAGLAHASAAIPEALYHQVNAVAAGALAEAAADRKLERFVFVSSVRAQSGPSSAGILNESSPPSPTDAYGRAKLEGERLVRAAGNAFVILRPVLIYGAGVKGNMAALAKLARMPVPLPFAGLDAHRSLLDIAGFNAAVELALSCPAAMGRTLLVADPEPVSIPDLIARMREAVGKPAMLFAMPGRTFEHALRLGGRQALLSRLSESLVVDTTQLRALGWAPPRPATQAIRAMMLGRS